MEVNNPQMNQNNMGQIDLSKTTPVACENKGCDSTIFQQAIEIRKMSALISPNGQAAIIPVQTFVCLKCNHIIDPQKLTQ